MKTPPFTLVLDSAHERALLTFHSGTTLPDLLAGAAALLAHPEWRDGFDELWDLRGMGEAQLSVKDLRALMDFDTKTGDGIRRTAIVVERFGLRMLALSYAQIAARLRPMRVFGTLEEALAWLDAS